MQRHQHLAAAVLAACLLAACGDGGGAALDTIPPLRATVPSSTGSTGSTAVAAASSTTSSPAATTSPVAPTTTATAVPALGLSPGGPWTLVDSAPGITTPGLVYELMPKLWAYLPLEEDLPNGIAWTFREEDREIIEAYLQARLVFFRMTETNPFDLDDGGWAQWYRDAGASYRSVLAGAQCSRRGLR